MNNGRLPDVCGVWKAAGTADAVVIGAGSSPPRKEVGTMGYLVIGIAYIVLTVVAVMKPRAGHA